MNDHSVTYVVLLACQYSLFEFFLKRLWWKRSLERRQVAFQALTLLATMVMGTLGFLSVTLIAGYAVITAVYWLYESKGRKRPEGGSLEWYLLKQMTMAVLLFVVWRVALPITVHDWYASVEYIVLGQSAGALKQKSVLILAILTAYLFVIDGGTRLVRGILGKFPVLYRKVLEALNADNAGTATPGESEENVGEWIGILERLITLTFVLTGNFTAIAFVLTAKSIARFKELEKSKDFAEYYLLGTSGSMIAAIGAGMLVRIIFGL